MFICLLPLQLVETLRRGQGCIQPFTLLLSHRFNHIYHIRIHVNHIAYHIYVYISNHVDCYSSWGRRVGHLRASELNFLARLPRGPNVSTEGRRRPRCPVRSQTLAKAHLASQERSRVAAPEVRPAPRTRHPAYVIRPRNRPGAEGPTAHNASDWPAPFPASGCGPNNGLSLGGRAGERGHWPSP